MKTGFRPMLVIVGVVLAGALPVQLPSQQAGPETMVLKGPTAGAVTFPHGAHEGRAECLVCHHASKPELPNVTEYARCHSCHTDTVEAPMVTNRRDAFHDRRARQGLCVDCHTQEAAAGKVTPARCASCHQDDPQ
jgi:hypothetical protein